MNELIDFSFFRGKKVLLTGHTGFKGSWLVYLLHHLGAITRGIALNPEENNLSLYQLMNGDSLVEESVITDIGHPECFGNILKEFKPDIIFHLAAQALVRESYKEPVQTYRTNVMGTAHLLQAVLDAETDCSIIIITTDKVYENKEWIYPYRESDRLGGHDPYSASKAASEIVIASYRKSFFGNDESKYNHRGIAAVRAGNVIGGGDWSKDRIIPDIIRSLEAGTPVNVRNPNAVRPWQHVLEPLFGYLTVARLVHSNPIKYADSYNFGPQITDNLTVAELVETAIKIYGKGTYIKVPQTNAPHEATLLRLDISKALGMLPWKPVWNASTAIERTIMWYKNINENSNAGEIQRRMQNDISLYLSNAGYQL